MSDFTTATAPWWFVAALAGTLTIVSTVLGALVSLWSTAASDKRRAKSEGEARKGAERQEWLRELRRLSADFIVATRSFVRAAQGAYTSEETADGGQRWSRKPGVKVDLTPAFVAYWNLVLAADEETGRMAQILMRQTRQYDVLDDPDFEVISNRDWTKMRAAVVSSRGSFAEHVMSKVAVSFDPVTETRDLPQ